MQHFQSIGFLATVGVAILDSMRIGKRNVHQSRSAASPRHQQSGVGFLDCSIVHASPRPPSWLLMRALAGATGRHHPASWRCTHASCPSLVHSPPPPPPCILPRPIPRNLVPRPTTKRAMDKYGRPSWWSLSIPFPRRNSLDA